MPTSPPEKAKPPHVQSTCPLKAIYFRDTDVLFNRVLLRPPLRKRIKAGQTPLQLLDELLIDDAIKEAITVLAYALPLREALLWSCLCIAEFLGMTMKREEQALFEKSVRWVMTAVEPLSRAAPEGHESLSDTAIYPVLQAILQEGALILSEQAAAKPLGVKRDQTQVPRQVIRSISRATIAGTRSGRDERLRRAMGVGIGVARGICQVGKAMLA